MAKRSETSRLIEAFRKRRQLSMLDLSLRAGLSMNYVRNVERGLRSLGPDAAESLAKELELNPTDRHALFVAVGRGLVPEPVQDALSCPVPGLIVWKTLPQALWSVSPSQAVPLYAGVDQVVTDLVRAAAPLLSWVWLCKYAPDNRQIRRLCERAEDVMTAETPTVPRVTTGATNHPAHEFTALLALPHLWRELLFDSRRSSETVVKLLDHWQYHPRRQPDRPDTLSFAFRDAELHQLWSVNAIAAGEIAGLHDLLLLSELFVIVADAGLNLGSPIAPTWPGAHRIKKLLKWAAGLTEDKLRRALPAAEPRHPLLYKYVKRLNRVRFARRIFERPYAAGMILGSEAARSLKDPVDAGIAILDRAIQLARSAT